MTLTEAQAMTPEEKRVKLAELDGCKRYERPFDRKVFLCRENPKDWNTTTNAIDCINSDVPDYCNDLNAVAEVEKGLTDEQYERYSTDLWNLVNPDEIRQPSHPTRCERAFLSATAEQRTTALILTLSRA